MHDTDTEEKGSVVCKWYVKVSSSAVWCMTLYIISSYPRQPHPPFPSQNFGPQGYDNNAGPG